MAEQIEFKRATLKAIQPGAKREYFRDEKTAHLVLAVTPAGAKSFQLVRKHQGQALRITLGRFDPDKPESEEIPRGTKAAPFDPLAYIGNTPRLNVRMARTLATAVSAALDRGENPGHESREARRARQNELTVGKAIQLYHDDWLVPNGRKAAAGTLDACRRLLGRVEPGQKKRHGTEKKKSPGAPDWQDRRLSTLKPADVRKMMSDIKDGGSAFEANRAMVLLRAVIRKMIDWQLFPGPDPTAGISKYPEPSRARFLRGDEAPRFFAALEKAPEVLRHFVLLALATGARRSNVLAMRWADLDFHSSLWTIPGEVSKNGAPMIVPLTGLALEILKARQDNGSEWVFPADSESGHAINISKQWNALLDAAGVADLRIHDLRRSLGSWAAIQGASLNVIGAALGHKSSAATRVYARLTVDPVREAMERASAAIVAAGNMGRNLPEIDED